MRDDAHVLDWTGGLPCRWACVLAAAIVLIVSGCDPLLHPPATGPASLAIQYSVAPSARIAMTDPDHVHIRVLKDSTVLYDSTLPFAPEPGEVRVRVELDLVNESESVNVQLELLQGARIVSRGQGSAVVRKRRSATTTILADGLADNLTLSYGTTCYLTLQGEAYCWGLSDLGHGDGNSFGSTGSSSRPVRMAGGLRFVSIDYGFQHGCALTESGEAYCWGTNSLGEIGDGTRTRRNMPTAVAGGLRFKQITVGTRFACGLVPTGEAYCWGDNQAGQLGSGGGGDATMPTPVGGNLRFDSIVAGRVDICGLASGVMYCWGVAMVGTGQPQVSTPTMQNTSTRFATLSLGANTRCGVTADGAGYCWSADSLNLGQLGSGTTIPSADPVAISGGHVFRNVVAAGGANAAHACGITIDATAYCWGTNRFGQLGASSGSTTCSAPLAAVGPTACSTIPIAVAGGHRFVSLGLGMENSCGLTEDGLVYCWGFGGHGALAQGDLLDRSTPVLIGAPVAPPTPTAIALTVPLQTMNVGDTIVASGYPVDQHGLAMPTAVFPFGIWSSSDTTRVAIALTNTGSGISTPVGPTRYLIARAPGSAAITFTTSTAANTTINRSVTIVVN